MKIRAIIGLFLVFLLTIITSPYTTASERPEFVPGELFVKFKPKIEAADIQFLKAKLSLKNLKIFKKIDVHHLKIAGSRPVLNLINQISKNSIVEYAVPNYIRYLGNTVPNDPKFADLWGFDNSGQTGGTAGADIDAPEAWDIITGSQDVTVAVIDSGMDLDHEELAANLWTNEQEFNGLPGIDDDGNGYVDDIHGWDFRSNDNNPNDPSEICSGHGTHVAGTIGAVGDNEVGVAGINWRVKIMPLRAFGPYLGIFCSGNDRDIIDAILYYASFGVRVSNNSYGGGPRSAAVETAIRAAHSVFIAAAGNGGNDGIGDNNDARPHFPSSYNLDDIIAVAATDHNDSRAPFSNYGRNSVDLAAPGDDIFSTKRNNGYGFLSGTSMATPHVAGAAALLLADDPGLTNREIKWRILKGADQIGITTLTRGRLNLYNSLMLASEVEIGLMLKSPTTVNPGDAVSVEVIVSNFSTAAKNVSAMLYTRLPDGSEITVQKPISFPIAPGGSLKENFSENVPADAPDGMYRIVARVWTPDFTVFDEDERKIVVIP